MDEDLIGAVMGCKTAADGRSVSDPGSNTLLRVIVDVSASSGHVKLSVQEMH